MPLHQPHAPLVLERVDPEAATRPLGLEQPVARLPLAQPLGPYAGAGGELSNPESRGSVFHDGWGCTDPGQSVAPKRGRVAMSPPRLPRKGRIHMAETATEVREQAQEKAQQAQKQVQQAASKATDPARTEIEQGSTA